MSIPLPVGPLPIGIVISIAGLTDEEREISELAFRKGYKDMTKDQIDRLRVLLASRGLVMLELGEEIAPGAQFIRWSASGLGWWRAKHVEDASPLRAEYGKIILVHPDFRFASKGAPQAPQVPAKEDEHARLQKFFFGKGPTPPETLPPPPKSFGRTYDSIWDD